MNTLIDIIKTARFNAGHIIIEMLSGLEIRFPVSANKRLRNGTVQELNRIEVSPYGLHWPDLDEDLSHRGLLAGDFGQE
jgi:Protein of unknown function (DUF2442)